MKRSATRGRRSTNELCFTAGTFWSMPSSASYRSCRRRDLRELAGILPHPDGNAGSLPPILAFMPHHGYQSNTEKYAEGPLGLAAIARHCPPS